MKLHRLVPLAAAISLAACQAEGVTVPPRTAEPAPAHADEVNPPPDSTGRGGHQGGSGN